MLELNNVDFSYHNKNIFNGLNFSLQDNKITTIIGPNGSGKSTLFKLLTRSEKAKSGEIKLDGSDIWTIQPRDFAKKVAIVHQQNQLYDEMTVNELIKMGRLPYNSLFENDQTDPEKLNKILNYLEIEPLKNKFVSELSGGQQQRVWLAVALAQEPEYLFLDEPTTYLDLHFQYRFLKLLKKLNRDQGLTICMILHDLNQALQFSDQVVLLNQGEIKKIGQPEEVITKEIISNNFKIDCEVIKADQGVFLRQY